MLGNLLGRPTNSWKRREVLLVTLTSIWYIVFGIYRGPKIAWIKHFNRLMRQYAPSRVILATLTILYALRHVDQLLGLHSPDPPAYLYSSGYYRATWINTSLDAGFATAMNIRPKWLRDISSLLCSVYYLINGDAADSKLRRLQQTCTLESLRATWDKTDNPYIRLITNLSSPAIAIRREIKIPRPADSGYSQDITAWLFFSGLPENMMNSTDLIVDFPGGGFVAMGPLHHEVRLRMWAIRSRIPVLSVAYSKAPEFPYPYAIEEGFDLYRAIINAPLDTLGISNQLRNIFITGDSAGGNIATNVVLKILGAGADLRRPAGLILTYPALNFAFTSWLWPHDPKSDTGGSTSQNSAEMDINSISDSLKLVNVHVGPLSESNLDGHYTFDTASFSAGAIHDHTNASLFQKLQEASQLGHTPANDASRMTMSSRAAFIHDRIINPSMMWAMAVLYLGQKWRPGLGIDYHVSPIMAPKELLAQFPPLLVQCGGNDPLVDDSVLFASFVQKAKQDLKSQKSSPTMETLTDGENNVCLQIFPGWSHGYLQMAPIFPAAHVAINDIADWICNVSREFPKVETGSHL